jgi:hypothetical protein
VRPARLRVFIRPSSSQHPYRSAPATRGPRSPRRVRMRRVAFLPFRRRRTVRRSRSPAVEHPVPQPARSHWSSSRPTVGDRVSDASIVGPCRRRTIPSPRKGSSAHIASGDRIRVKAAALRTGRSLLSPLGVRFLTLALRRQHSPAAVPPLKAATSPGVPQCATMQQCRRLREGSGECREAGLGALDPWEGTAARSGLRCVPVRSADDRTRWFADV